MMQRYAAVAGLPARRVLPVPRADAAALGHWVGARHPGAAARSPAPLVELLMHEVVCREHDIAEYVPDPPEGRIGFDTAVALALAQDHAG